MRNFRRLLSNDQFLDNFLTHFEQISDKKFGHAFSLLKIAKVNFNESLELKVNKSVKTIVLLQPRGRHKKTKYCKYFGHKMPDA